MFTIRGPPNFHHGRRMPSQRANEYRRKAEECRGQGERAKDDSVKASWLKLAAQWQRLAEEIAPSIQQGQQPQTKEQP
jgi:hypothetical protein